MLTVAISLSLARGMYLRYQMDEQTLLAHRMFWGIEATSHPASELRNLTVEEQTLYTKLKTIAFAPNLRLEQERIEWGYIACVLAAQERELMLP